MATLPPSKLAQIQFFETHIPIWQANFAAIGLTTGQVTTLTTLTTAARTAFDASEAAREASLAATTTLNNTHRGMRDFGGGLINTIRAFAETGNNPAVYATAQIPPPAAPSPAPPPDAPTNPLAALENNGSITIRWDVTQPAPGAGIYTAILRQLNGAGAFVPLGDTGEKQFNDPTVPPGSQRVTYLLQTRRSGSSGQSSPFSEPLTVFLGVPQDGGDEQQLQLAA